MSKYFRNRPITAIEILTYIPIFSLFLSIVYNVQIEIYSSVSIVDSLGRIGEFSFMIFFGFLSALSFSFLSMILTMAAVLLLNFRILESFWKFWICHTLMTFTLFFLLINHFSDDSGTDTSTIDLLYWLVRLCIPYLLSLPLAGVLTMALKDFVSRRRGAGRNQW